MVWKDSAIWFLHVQCSEGQPCDFWVRHKDSNQQLKVSKAWAVQYWRDSKIYWSKDLTDFMADALGLREGDLNPAWIPDVVPEVPVVPVLPGFWELIKNSWGNALGIFGHLLTAPIITAINSVHNLMKGSDIDRETAESWSRFVPGVNAAYKLAYGKDLSGAVNESLSAEDYVELALFLVPLPTSWISKWFGKIFARGGGVLTNKVLRELAEKEASIVGRGASQGQLSGMIKTEQLRQAAREFANAKPFWKKLADQVFSVKMLVATLIGVMSFDAWNNWAATDNIATSIRFDVKDLPEKIEAGEISQEEAIAEIQILREYFDVAKKKVDVSTAINPIAHFLTPTFQDNMELLGHDLDRKEAEILAAIPGAPVGVEGTVRIVSVPVGARIFVDDVDKWSKTDTSLRLVEGVHKLVLKLDDYIDFVREIEVFADKPMSYSALLVSSSGEDPYTPFDPGSGTVPVIVPLDPSESFVEPVNAWQYTITARDSLSGEVLHAKIIVNNVFTGDYTTDVIFLAPSSEYSLRLEAYGYEPAEIVLNTEALEAL